MRENPFQTNIFLAIDFWIDVCCNQLMNDVRFLLRVYTLIPFEKYWSGKVPCFCCLLKTFGSLIIKWIWEKSSKELCHMTCQGYGKVQWNIYFDQFWLKRRNKGSSTWKSLWTICKNVIIICESNEIQCRCRTDRRFDEVFTESIGQVFTRQDKIR